MGTERRRPGAHRREQGRQVTSRLPHVPGDGAGGRARRNAGVNWGTPDEDEEYQDPVSLSELRADDELLNTLGRGEERSGLGAVFSDRDDAAVLLREWRASVDSEPVPELVETNLAMATLAGATKRATSRRKHPVLMPVAGAAAGLVVAVGALAGVARTAQPGGSLWDVSKVLYTDHARSVVATNFVRQHLQHARAAMRSGRHEQALGDMAAVSRHLPAVQDGTAKDALVAAWRKVEDELHMTPPSASAPSARQRAEATRADPPRSTSAGTQGSTVAKSTRRSSSAASSTEHRTSSTSRSSSTGKKPTTQSGDKPSTQSGGKPSTQSGEEPSTQSGESRTQPTTSVSPSASSAPGQPTTPPE